MNRIPDSKPPEALRDVPKLTRRYAQTRTLPTLVKMAGFMVLILAYFALSHFAGQAKHAGNLPLFRTLFVGGFIFYVLSFLFLIFFGSERRWAGRWLARLEQRMYAREGHVELGIPKHFRTHPNVGRSIGVWNAFFMLAWVYLGYRGYYTLDVAMPTSAIFMVPMLLVMYFWMRPAMNPFFLLWPVLYALHALLIVAGAPILITGPWWTLNLLIPAAVYPVLCGIAGHFYNRYALRRLKKAVRDE